MSIDTIDGGGIIGLQRRMRQLGEIRIGHVIDTGRVSEKTGRAIKYPGKLKKFRITAASRPTLEEVARLYGGTVQPWTPANGGPTEWEVYTETDRLPIIVPPRRALSQWYEQYQGSKCTRRCDGQVEQKSDKPCFCNPDNRACALTTRLNVMLRDVPGLGVWLLTSHGQTAGGELPLVVEFLATTGGYVDAFLTMEEVRVTLEDGKVAEFMVPKIDVAVTPAQLLAGQGAISPQAVASTQQRAALTGDRAAISAPIVPSSAAEVAPAAIAAPMQSAPLRDFVAEIKAATSKDDVLALWNAARNVGAPNAAEIQAAAKARATELDEQASPMASAPAHHIAAAQAAENLDQLTVALKAARAAGYALDLEDQADQVAQSFVIRRRGILAADEAGVPEAPTTPPPMQQHVPAQSQDADALWSQIIAVHPADQTAAIEQEISERFGVLPSQATADQLAAYLADLTAGTRAQTPVTVPAAAPTDDLDVPF